MSYLETVFAAAIALLIYVVSLGVYRIWFSPVAEIPGPLLAKLTYWYEYYWDVVQVGRYAFHIRELHDKYGPIIRINPHEVHIDDPDFYDEIYTSTSSGKKRNKWAFMINGFGVFESIFTTEKHEVHRTRRAALNPFFSKAKIRDLQGTIDRTIDKLLARMHEFQVAREPMSLGLALTAIANDISESYAFDSQEFRIDAPDFAPDFHIAAEKLAKQAHFMKQFPWLLPMIQALPVAWVKAMDPEMAAYMDLQISIQKRTREIQEAFRRPDYKAPRQSTIFHEILNSTHLSVSEKGYARLWQDAQTIVVAGTITTASAFTDLFFFLLSDPAKLKRLRNEILTAVPDKDATIQLSVVEALPYLTACIMEALRFSCGVCTRLQRLDPDKSIVFHAKPKGYGAPAPMDKTYVLPAGTPVSMTTLLIHYNPKIYPDPNNFVPERWLATDPTTGKDFIHRKLDKYFVPFSRGTRSCLGLNLAWAELYLLMVAVFQRYGSKEVQMPGDEGYLELFDSSYERDIEIVGDGITPIVREPFKGIKVKIFSCDDSNGK